jgi:putative ABC transport system substrate-binding protein
VATGSTLILRYLPLVGVSLLLAIAFAWRPWLQHRRHGHWGILLFRSESRAQNARDAMAFVLFAVLIAQAVIAARWPEALPLSEADRRSTPAIGHAIGAVLLFGGLILLVAAQLKLGASWRIGIEEGARPGLVTGGLYRVCRNPIFLALLVILAGYTLLLPTLLSALMLAGAYLAIRQQIAAEESYLLRTYGEEYRDYARRVGRLLPGIGKLPLALVLTLAAIAAPSEGWSQAPAARVGLLGPDEQPRFSEIASGLRQGLREQGYAEGTVEIVEARVRRSDDASARATVETLAGKRVTVLFVIGSNIARVAREVMPALPIVFITPGDPVAAGLVTSLARPGNNMTALTFEYPELSAKRLELLRELGPSIRRVLVLYDPRDASPRQGTTAARAAARALGFTLLEVQVRNAQEITEGLKKLDDADALLGIPGGITSAHYEAMIGAANSRHRPTVLFTHSPSTRNALLSYGASDIEVARQAARALVKIFKGANAGDLAVERPSKLTLVVNLKTAKALGIAVPRALLVRADEVIE